MHRVEWTLEFGMRLRLDGVASTDVRAGHGMEIAVDGEAKRIDDPATFGEVGRDSQGLDSREEPRTFLRVASLHPRLRRCRADAWRLRGLRNSSY